MKQLILYLLAIILPGMLAAQKYNAIIIEGEKEDVHIKSDENRRMIKENCSYLAAETAWNNDLSQFNADECTLYSDYMSFSDDHLDWIDEVEITSEYDENVGMEVEVITFYNDGKEVPAEGFLKSRISKCKGETNKESVEGCAVYFADLAKQSLEFTNRVKDLATSSETVLTNVQENTQKEIDDLKGSRRIVDIKKIKTLKNNMKSVDKTQQQASVLLPTLSEIIADDYAKIHGISMTLKKMEQGL